MMRKIQGAKRLCGSRYPPMIKPRPSISIEGAALETPKAVNPWYENPVWIWIAFGAWIVALVVISVMVGINPTGRTVTGLYHDASYNWFQQKPLYNGPSGMNYFPQFAPSFFLLHWLPVPIGDIAWRWLSGFILFFGIWRLVKNQFQSNAFIVLPWILLMALPLSLSALRYGQANALFSGLLVNVAASIAQRRWTGATLWMMLAVIVKPLGLVIFLLAPFVYVQLRWKVLEAILVLVLAPFFVSDFDYVLSQYFASFSNLQSCSAVAEHRFADFHGIIRTFGVELPPTLVLGIRFVAALATLGIWFVASRRFDEPLRAIWLLALTTIYLMLFNPMNESNSYVILAPALSIWALILLATSEYRALGWCLVGCILSIGLLKEPLRPIFGNGFALLWNPVMALAFFGVLMLILRDAQNSKQILIPTKDFNQK